MAKHSRAASHKAAPKKAKSMGKAKPKMARPAPKKAKPASRPMAKPKMARPAAKRPPARAKATQVEKSAVPGHAVSHLAEMRAQAKAQRTPHTKLEEQAEHDHQDPRLAGIDNIHAEAGKVGGRSLNYGQIKNGSRYQNTVNWFRRAAHPKQ